MTEIRKEYGEDGAGLSTDWKDKWRGTLFGHRNILAPFKMWTSQLYTLNC